MLASGSTNSKELTLVTELTNKGPSDADGTVCEIHYTQGLLIPNPNALGKNCTTSNEKEAWLSCPLDNVPGIRHTNLYSLLSYGIIGLDVNGTMSAKARIETHFISIDESQIDDLIDSGQVQVCCGSLNATRVCVNGKFI